MITVSSATKAILLNDAVAIEALQTGILNTSAYAKRIHSMVEKKTMKPVAIGTIVVALSRLAKKIKTQSSFNPLVAITSMSVKSALIEITYEKTHENITKLNQLNTAAISNEDFFTVTEGIHEITIICEGRITGAIINHFSSQPKARLSSLVAISVRFSADYMEIPNTIYSLIRILATKHINLIEIVSTYTELTFIVYQHEMEPTLHALHEYSQKSA